MNIPDLEAFINLKHCLPDVGTWRKSVHVFDERTAQAIRAALASGRPLLVRGEPGTGKSQLARAAASVLGRKFLSHVVDAHTEVQDLWYRFDAVSRLGNAQVLSVTGKGKNEQDVDDKLKAERYLSPGILWWAFDWQNASENKGEHPFFIPDEHDPGDENKGVVLLLDEIDKADADLPNSLLETLDNGKFTVPWIKQTVGAANGVNNRPLVVITTNEDRQLPGAFVRRCMVLDLRLPKDKSVLIRYLKERAAFHFPIKAGVEAGDCDQPQPLQRDDKGKLLCESRFHAKVLDEAAEQLYRDRQEANSLGVTLACRNWPEYSRIS
jgi:MoxR-like ATPase